MTFNNVKRVFSPGSLLFATTISFLLAAGFDISRSDNDDTVNVISVAFLHKFFSNGGLPEIDLANTCNNNNGNVFPGTSLAICHQLGDDVKTCQNRGKIVTISLGGATGSTAFSSDGQARTFAETVWNLFLGGSSDIRPFGDAVLDGYLIIVSTSLETRSDAFFSVDLDIEGGSGTGMPAFVTRLRELSKGASKSVSTDSALGRPTDLVLLTFPIDFPNKCRVSFTIAVIFIDLIMLGQYNNYCGVNNYYDSNAWNFGVWDDWAKNTSPNKNIKIFVGAPAAESAANTGYVNAETLGKIAQETRSKYSSFGGIMLWDISQAYGKLFLLLIIFYSTLPCQATTGTISLSRML
ncbi:hypothetical protein C0989_009283 [Termitomyces sp. Mn162]|nr:hypothetical protein C0989_009283 [Termitomyces sp. Mn162]